MTSSMAERLKMFTHWVVHSEASIRGMVELLWTHQHFFAIVPAEESGEMVLCIDQAGWDLLAEAGEAGVTEHVTKTGRMLTERDFDDLVEEAERGYDVSHLTAGPRLVWKDYGTTDGRFGLQREALHHEPVWWQLEINRAEDRDAVCEMGIETGFYGPGAKQKCWQAARRIAEYVDRKRGNS